MTSLMGESQGHRSQRRAQGHRTDLWHTGSRLSEYELPGKYANVSPWASVVCATGLLRIGGWAGYFP